MVGRVGMLGAVLSVSCAGPSRTPDPSPTAPIPTSVAEVLPAPDPTLALGLAGVPNDLLGDEAAPAFAEVFAEIASYGFDRFVPVFLTNENGEGGAFGTYFVPQEAFPEDVFGPIPREVTCEGPFDPWAAAPEGLHIVLPGYLLTLDQPVTAPLDPTVTTRRFEALLRDCLDGDASLAPEIYSFDEPANNYASSLCCDGDPDSTYALSGVATLAEVARTVLGADTMVVEAPMQFFLPLVAETWAIPEDQVSSILDDYEAGLTATAPHADHYGFDVYPVDLSPSLGVIADHVALARATAPDAEPLVVLQGFGMADMGIDVGTPGRAPTRDETRAMGLLAVASGARGVYWYGQSALTSDDPVWADLRELARDLRALSGIFTLPDGALPDGTTVPAGITASVREGDGVRWIVLVDGEGAGGTVVLPGSALDALGAPLDTDDGTVTVELPAYGSRVLAWFEATE